MLLYGAENHRENLMTITKKLFSDNGKEPSLNTCGYRSGTANSFPVARGSNRNRQSGRSPGSSVNALRRLPMPSAQWRLPDRWLLQWRDRAGFQPASLSSLATPNPVRY